MMTIGKHFLIAAGAALMFALPAAAQAQADQPAAAANQSAAAAAAPAADTSAAKDYPRCSKTVTDSCVQSEAGSRGKAQRGKAKHHRKT
jgi:hypothetical protein